MRLITRQVDLDENLLHQTKFSGSSLLHASWACPHFLTCSTTTATFLFSSMSMRQEATSISQAFGDRREDGDSMDSITQRTFLGVPECHTTARSEPGAIQHMQEHVILREGNSSNLELSSSRRLSSEASSAVFQGTGLQAKPQQIYGTMRTLRIPEVAAPKIHCLTSLLSERFLLKQTFNMCKY